MNTTVILVNLFLLSLTALCFYLPYKGGKEKTAWSITFILGVLIVSSLLDNFELLVALVYVITFSIQIIFITYWSFRLFGRKKIGIIITTGITGVVLYIAMQPWITDWTFNENDAREILSHHNIELKDDFELIKNESGGMRDYYHLFTLKIGDSDYKKIAYSIRGSNNFKGLIDLKNEFPYASHLKLDTLNFETKNHIEREYFLNQKLEDGTFHFRFILSKTKSELQYVGSNE